ncbi:ribose 5-phosphate isomerase A [Halobacillus sp. BBL2006]|uniref:ribose 5-phosphate isomerase A n=1 Tax=Halobacillus sp. BBL2006 TaxID=1543706 RepID=UPI000543C1F1|nr:ribose 5-phosphate isomerase A [Halobacillus sp. BBL2006]KHE70794.1 ribose 5-phosphate isomerase [Halobacillus sp. BBL2006]
MKWQNQLAVSENWTGEISNLEEKVKVANRVSQFVKQGDVIGVGSGSTSFLAVKKIAERVKQENLEIITIPTSQEALLNCSALGLKTTSLSAAKPDWAFDGADEVDSNKRLIKGRGGAMFAEKLVMASAPKTYILVDESKFVTRLGEKFAVPIEVDPRAVNLVETYLNNLQVQEVDLRMAQSKDGPVITEAGNLILDARFGEISDEMEMKLSAIPGVVETGLFIDYSVEILTI